MAMNGYVYGNSLGREAWHHVAGTKQTPKTKAVVLRVTASTDIVVAVP
jgi:hypothetical protein